MLRRDINEQKTIVSRSKEVLIPLYSTLGKHVWSSESSSELPSIRKTWTYQHEYSKGL